MQMTLVIGRDGSNRTLYSYSVLVLEYKNFLSNHTCTRVQSKVIVLILEYITKVIVLTITSHDYIFSYEQLQANILGRNGNIRSNIINVILIELFIFYYC